MKVPVLLLTIFSLMSCAMQPVALELDLSHMKRGIMKMDESGAWHVVKNGPELVFQADPACSTPNSKAPCMWYGFEFDYSTADAPTFIECRSRTSSTLMTTSVANGTRALEHSFNLELSEATGHASYKTRVSQDLNFKSVKISSACAYKTIERLHFESIISGFN